VSYTALRRKMTMNQELESICWRKRLCPILLLLRCLSGMAEEHHEKPVTTPCVRTDIGLRNLRDTKHEFKLSVTLFSNSQLSYFLLIHNKSMQDFVSMPTHKTNANHTTTVLFHNYNIEPHLYIK
jgi:hypothetical protein